MTVATPISVPTQMFSFLQKKRGTVRGLAMHICSQLASLEAAPEATDLLKRAHQNSVRLHKLTEEFREHYYAIIDLLDEESDAW